MTNSGLHYLDGFIIDCFGSTPVNTTLDLIRQSAPDGAKFASVVVGNKKLSLPDDVQYYTSFVHCQAGAKPLKRLRFHGAIRHRVPKVRG